MGIPRKKSRQIVVNGRAFRWMLKGNTRYIGDTPASFRFIAQEETNNPGRVLLAFPATKLWERDHSLFGGHRASFLPSDASAIIQKGLECGWNPSERGGPFDLDINLDLTEFELCATRVSALP